MGRLIRPFLLVESASFILAGLAHFGVLVRGYEHRQAATAESAIGMVLVVGLVLTWIWQTRLRPIGIAAQAFALLGTLVGAFTIAIGVGPRTVPDIVYHLTILAVLICGLALAARSRTETRRSVP